MKRIKSVIDKYFDFMEEIDGNSYIDEWIPETMLDKSKKQKYEGILYWNAIASTIDESEILELEKLYGHPFPASYKSFLQYRHFLELQLGTFTINFFKNSPGTILQDTKEAIKKYYINLVQRNYLPFAVIGEDREVLCFDATNAVTKNEYPIVAFTDADGFMQEKKYASNFESMFIEFESHLDDWIKTKREIIKSER